MLKDSLSKQLLIWMIILPVIILSFIVIILFYQNYAFSNYTDMKEEINNKYTHVETIDKMMNMAFVDFSRFVIANELVYLEEQTHYEEIVKDEIAYLNQIATSDVDESFVKSIETFHRYYFEEIIASATFYTAENQPEEIIRLFNSSIFNQEINEFSEASRLYKEHLDNQTSQADEMFNQGRQQFNYLVIAYFLISILTILIIFRLLLRRIAIPLRELTEAADQVSAGIRNIDMEELNRNDELGMLSTSFRRMVTKVKQSENTEQKLNKELFEKNKELEQIVYIASHDLRSPLINIQGFNKELQTCFDEIQDTLQNSDDLVEVRVKLVDVMEEDIPEAFHYILSSTDKMDLLLNGLLRLSRIGREKPDMELLDMNLLFSRVLKNFEFQINQENIRVDISNLPKGVGDASLMDQVISNLIGNALKFTHPDRPGQIKIHGYEENERSIYCVEDNGIGISPQYQEQIFKLFEKIDPYNGGEGLGLTIVGKIINRHEGTIWIESELDQYSKFYFSLPNYSTSK